MVDVLVTGGAGFIGSNFVRYALGAHPDWRVTTLDKLTYAGRRENLHDVMDNPRHAFVHGDIADAVVSGPLVERSEIVVHFAAETHVDRSIMGAGDFIRTDVEGTFVLLEAARRAKKLRRFVQISTDEVYGSVPTGASVETDELKPRNPYAASKAGADRLAYSYWATYQLPVIITRASNNYGSYQFPEKVIPLFVTNAIDDIPVPLYGDGKNVRDWLHVLDHCRAVDLLIDRATDGEVYNIGGGNDVMNIDLTHRILDALGKPRSLIKPVADRPGHDRRYCLDTTQAARNRMDTAGAVRGRSRRRREVVSAERVVVAADQGARSGVQGVLPGSVRKAVSGAARPSSDHRCNRFRRRAPGRVARRLESARRLGPIHAATGNRAPRGVAGRRSPRSRAGATRDRQPSAVNDFSSRRCAARRGVVARHGQAAGGKRPCHVSSLRCHSAGWTHLPRARHGIGCRLRALGHANQGGRHTRPRQSVRAQQARPGTTGDARLRR